MGRPGPRGTIAVVIDPSSFAAAGWPTRRVTVEATVAAPAQEAFDAWVDPGRVVEFMGHAASVDLRIGGRYEVLFLEDAPAGQQGS